MQNKSGGKLLFWGLLVVFVVFSLGFIIGQKTLPSSARVGNVFNKEPLGIDSQVNFAPFWEAWKILEERYVSASTTQQSPVTAEKRLWSAIQGLAAAYDDPYTVFLPPAENEIFNDDISGNFEGVGMEVGMRDGILTVIAPLKNSPAEKAGIKSGDMILEINKKTTKSMSIEEAISIIRGPKGSEVSMTLMSPDNGMKTREVSVIRDIIEIPIIETELINDPAVGKVFVIRFFSFSANSTELFKNALIEFQESNTDKLILDMRGNPGGYLDASIEIASWFLPEGKVVVREIINTDEEKVYRSKGYDAFTDALKMVILVDRGSASASEILAGALREHGIARLVGETTFGKGSVQELIPVTANTSIKVTIARWLTPNGVSISENGLKPDVVPDDDNSKEKDPMLDAALRALGEM